MKADFICWYWKANRDWRDKQLDIIQGALRRLFTFMSWSVKFDKLDKLDNIDKQV